MAALINFDEASLFQGDALVDQSWIGSSVNNNTNTINASATYSSVGSAIVNAQLTNELDDTIGDSDDYPGYGYFTPYQVNLTFTNNTNEAWTDFHFNVGLISQVDSPVEFELSSGVDQPLQITNLSLLSFSPCL